MRIAHITDCHVVVAGDRMADRIDSGAQLERAVVRLRGLDPAPDLVVATGDLTNDARPAEYDRLIELLEPLDLPLLPIPGNHDARGELRRRFSGLPDGDTDDPIDHVIDLDAGLRIVALDTTVPGEAHGLLRPDQLDWLHATLADHTGPTVIAQHHPPFLSGIDWMDRFALRSFDDELAVIERHAHVVAVLCGHYHRPSTVHVAGTVVWCAPSSAAQIALDVPQVTYTTEQSGFAVHDIAPDGLVRTHLVVTDPLERWRPAWSLAADE